MIEERATIIVGAGPTGLSAAYHLGGDALLLEQHDRVGGWCRSIEDNGFTFDYAGHIMFSKDPYVHQLYRLLLGDNIHWQEREAWIYSQNVYTRYPFQGSLYGLPAEVIKECIIGAIEARCGSITETQSDSLANRAAPIATSKKVEPAFQANRPELALERSEGWRGSDRFNHSAHRCKADAPLRGSCHGDDHGLEAADLEALIDCCADGALDIANGRNGGASQTTRWGEPRNFEEFIYKVWGRGIAKHFAIPYNRKLWAVPLTEIETSWLGGRVPMPNLEEMIEGALKPVPKPMGPNARFGYPLRGGFQALMDGFLPRLKGELRLGTRIVAVSPRRHVVTLAGGTELRYDHLVSTIPLPMLVRLIGDEAPQPIREAAAGLRHTSVRCVNIGIGRERLTEKHWIYYPADTVFHRIFLQGNASPLCNAPGGFGLTCEITYGPSKPLPCDGEDLVKLCIEDCIRVGLFSRADPIWAANQLDIPYAYVIYDHGRAARVAAIRSWLSDHDIILAGRYSEWEYYNSDHAFMAGKRAAETVRERRQSRLHERAAAT